MDANNAESKKMIVENYYTSRTKEQHSLVDFDDSAMTVNYYTGPDTWRLVNTDGEEQLLSVIGGVSQKMIPPVVRQRNDLVEREAKSLRQQVFLTGFGSQEFKANEGAVDRVAELFSNSIHGRKLKPFVHPKQIGGCEIFHCFNRYFSDHRDCPDMGVCEFERGVDPKGILHKITDEYQWLFHSEDNRVKYTRSEMGDGELEYVQIDPKDIERGDVVEALVTFTAVPTADNTATLLPIVKGICVLQKANPQVETAQGSTASAATMSAPKTAGKLKRKTPYEYDVGRAE